MGVKILLVGGKYQDVTAGVLQTSIQTRYKFTEHVGGILGITRFVSDVTVEDELEKYVIEYNYSGAFVGMHSHAERGNEKL